MAVRAGAKSQHKQRALPKEWSRALTLSRVPMELLSPNSATKALPFWKKYVVGLPLLRRKWALSAPHHHLTECLHQGKTSLSFW